MWLTAVIGVGGLVALSGVAGVAWLTSPGDIFSQFRLQAAPRAGYVMTEPVQLLARPRLVLESAAIHAADRASDEDSSVAAARSRRLIIDKPVISVDVGAQKSTAEDAVARVLEPIIAKIAILDIQTLAIRGGLVKLLSSAVESEFLTDVDLQITPHRRSSAAIVGEATFRGQRLKLNATINKAAASGTQGRWPMQAAISGELFEARFDGAIGEEKGLRLTGAIDLSAARLREVARWIGTRLPRAGNLEALRLKGDLDWTGGTMSFSKATVALDGNEGAGAITLSNAGGRAALEGTLAFKRLNLTPYVTSTMVERTLLAPIFAASQPPAIASLLDSLDADLRISTDALVIPGITTGQGAAAVTLKHGKLLADVAELSIEDGVFKGQLVVDRIGTDPRYGLTGKLEGVEAGRLLQGSLGRNPLHGKATMTMTLATAGDGLEELMMRLEGKGNIAVREGGRLGLDLRTLIQSARRAELQGWTAAGSANTSLEDLALAIDVHKGIVHATISQAKSGSSALFGGGYVDLPGRTLEFSLGVRPADSSTRVAATSEVLRLSGPWHVPTITLERSEGFVPRPPPALAPARPIERK